MKRRHDHLVACQTEDQDRFGRFKVDYNPDEHVYPETLVHLPNHEGNVEVIYVNDDVILLQFNNPDFPQEHGGKDTRFVWYNDHFGCKRV